MIRTLTRSWATLLLVAPAATAQLPYLNAPSGTLRIELDGGFMPTSREYADGKSRHLGDPLNAVETLDEGLAPRLTALLGRPASPASVGSLTADLMHQRGEGGIGLAVGITHRITASVRLPIVSVRTESRLQHDGTDATLGLNPALRGNGTSAAWLTQFATALVELQTRRDAGDYAGDPVLQALADQVLASAPAWRDGMSDLLVDDGQASLLLPLATSLDGAALLQQAGIYRDQLADQLGVNAPNGVPAFPTESISASDFNSLLVAEEGFGLGPVETQPVVGIGDVEFGLVYALTATSNPANRSWFGTWITGGLRLPTGAVPRANRIRDQGTGDGQMDVRVGGVVEAGRGRVGIRAEASFEAHLAGEREVRVGSRDAFLLPANRTALLAWNPGDMISLTARPFFRIADRLAITGSASYFRKSTDQWDVTGSSAPDPAALALMAAGTASSALRLGAGLSYAHDGRHVDGASRMPVEAGLAIERTAWSGSGLVAQQVVTRMWFRVYKRLF